MSSLLQSTIVSLEHETWAAQTRSGASLLPYLSPRCTMLFPLGLIVSASTTPSLNDVLTSSAFVPWTSYTMSKVSVVELSTTGAVIMYEVQATRPPLGPDGRAETFRALASSTWTLEEASGKWLMLVHQQTPFDKNIAEDGL